MKIELLTSLPVPCTEHTAFAGMRFDVEGHGSRGAVWIRHMGGLVFVEAINFREVTAETKSVAWLACRFFLTREKTGEFLPQITQMNADGKRRAAA